MSRLTAPCFDSDLSDVLTLWCCVCSSCPRLSGSVPFSVPVTDSSMWSIYLAGGSAAICSAEWSRAPHATFTHTYTHNHIHTLFPSLKDTYLLHMQKCMVAKCIQNICFYISLKKHHVEYGHNPLHSSWHSFFFSLFPSCNITPVINLSSALSLSLTPLFYAHSSILTLFEGRWVKCKMKQDTFIQRIWRHIIAFSSQVTLERKLCISSADSLLSPKHNFYFTWMCHIHIFHIPFLSDLHSPFRCHLENNTSESPAC